MSCFSVYIWHFKEILIRLITVQILCIGTDRSQQTVPTKIRLLFAIPSTSFGCINAMLHETFLVLGLLWQLFEVSQILEFLRYSLYGKIHKLM